MTRITQEPELAQSDWVARKLGAFERDAEILLHAPTAALQAPGGGEHQLIQTGRHLEQLGEEVGLFCPWRDRLEAGRLLHLFGMSREGLALARVARARGARVVLSPICWFEPRAHWMLAGGGLLGTWTLAAWAARRFLPGLPDWRRELLRLADAILPNSHAEAEQLVELLAADPRRVVVIPNGVEDREAYLGGRDDMRAERGHVLYAGRIEPRKNVLGLIQAAAVASLPLLVIGDSVPGFEAYGAFCREAGARNGVRFLPRMEPDDSRLIDAFARARVVALPSWFETPGLAALEGALAGAAVVVTPYGSAREYFGKRALYARPDRPEEIRRALADAWQNGAPSDLAAHVRRSFSWSRIAALTAEVYAR